MVPLSDGYVRTASSLGLRFRTAKSESNRNVFYRPNTPLLGTALFLDNKKGAACSFRFLGPPFALRTPMSESYVRSRSVSSFRQFCRKLDSEFAFCRTNRIRTPCSEHGSGNDRNVFYRGPWAASRRQPANSDRGYPPPRWLRPIADVAGQVYRRGKPPAPNRAGGGALYRDGSRC